jgi:hypothetical protein
MYAKPLTNTELIAPCGMNCSICMAYLREKNKCPGCRDLSTYKPITRIRCKIKTCNKLKTKFCFDCEDFPCKNLNNLDKRYRTKYHMSMIANLKSIKERGIHRFLKNEKTRWACPKCGGAICVHKGYCLSCNKK